MIKIRIDEREPRSNRRIVRRDRCVDDQMREIS